MAGAETAKAVSMAATIREVNDIKSALPRLDILPQLLAHFHEAAATSLLHAFG
jgi:hypothetical protein